MSLFFNYSLTSLAIIELDKVQHFSGFPFPLQYKEATVIFYNRKLAKSNYLVLSWVQQTQAEITNPTVIGI